MIKLSTILAALALLGLTGAPALAQTANKTWVSSASGSDSGTCQFVSPCKTFAYAISQTVAGGEVDVKDAGSYGTLTINKAISIVGNGALAAIAVPSGATGITINVGSSDNVILQGLTIDGHGVGVGGILYSGGASLTVQQCQIRNMTSNGIEMDPGTYSLKIADTTISNNKGAGVYVNTSGVYPTADLDNVKLYGNSKGLYAANSSNVVAINSTLSYNGDGIYTDANGSATVYFGQSSITTSQQYAIDIEGGAVKSYGDNYIVDNVYDIKGTLGSATKR